MDMDGWSNQHKEPILCVSITTPEGDTFLTETVDTQDEQHTGDNLEAIASKSITKVEEDFGCTVRSFVTDNASNMKKMRSQLEQDLPIITYPCSSHVADRLAKDVEIPDAKNDVVSIAKYFRNHHRPGAWYRAAGGKMLPLPSAVRWNSVTDTLQAYIDNWSILVSVVKSHKSDMDTTVCEMVLDINIKRKAEDYLSRTKPISVALDKLQSDTCHISDAVKIWKDLQQDFEGMPLSVSKPFQSRIKIALTPAHYLAYILDPRYKGQSLSNEEVNQAMAFCSEHHPAAMASVVKFRAQCAPFQPYMFTPELVNDLSPIVWWQSQASCLDPAVITLTNQLHSAKASSAGIERIFSTFGFVHSKVRNRLGTQKAGKLVFLYKVLNLRQ